MDEIITVLAGIAAIFVLIGLPSICFILGAAVDEAEQDKTG